MPRYFLNLAPGHPIDVEGEELPDDATAIEVARQTAREMLRDGPPTIPEERVVVSSENGELVDVVYLEDQFKAACEGVAASRPNQNGFAMHQSLRRVR
jgi:hypothetical protein